MATLADSPRATTASGRRGFTSARALAVIASCVAGGALQVAPNAGAKTQVTSQWLGYHGGGNGAGVAVGISSVDTSKPAWRSPVLDGQIYGEPLVFDHEVIVATENDSVYALTSATGAVRWRRHLGRAVPSGELPCGNISPTVGITGTPAIDPRRHEVFVLDFEKGPQVSRHFLYGLNVDTGAPMMRRGLTTPTPDQLPYLNRGALAVDDGSVIYTLGGTYGDCPTYHGVVGAVSETAPMGRALDFVVDAAPGESQGAIWMGGAAPSVDPAGHIWVASGNGSVTTPGHPYDHSDGALELGVNMRLRAFFAPTNWYQDNANDADLSAEPAVLKNGLIVATGKSGHVYLFREDHPGGVGGQITAIDSHCGDVLDGGVVIHGAIVYLPCASGPVAVRVVDKPAGIRLVWHASAGGGPPLFAAQLVWSIGRDGVLYALDADNGSVVKKAYLGALANHFSTPSVGAGLPLAATARQVVAFAAR